MSSIKLVDAAEFFKAEPHQIEAFNYLQENTSKPVLEEFAKKYRSQSKVPSEGLSLIKQFEGCKLHAYPDPLSGGLPITIGWGSTKNFNGSPFRLGDTISQDYADDLLVHQLENDYLNTVSKIPFWGEMNNPMRGALLSFAYNLGPNFYGSTGFKTISSCLREKRWRDVPSALLLYINPGTSVTEGLRRRRQAEGNLWNSGLSLITNG